MRCHSGIPRMAVVCLRESMLVSLLVIKCCVVCFLVQSEICIPMEMNPFTDLRFPIDLES